MFVIRTGASCPGEEGWMLCSSLVRELWAEKLEFSALGSAGSFGGTGDAAGGVTWAWLGWITGVSPAMIPGVGSAVYTRTVLESQL